MVDSSSSTVNTDQTNVGISRTENFPVQVTTIWLTKENYLQWSAAITMGIAGRGRIAYVNERKVEPVATSAAWDTWFLEDNQVKTWIVNFVSSDIQPLILQGGNDHKGSGNPFSYGSTVKLDGHNYELWSRSFMLSVKGHRKKHIIEEDEPINKTGKYITLEEDDSMVMSWMMNSVQPQIASTITYYTTAKEMWDFLRQTYSQDKNVSKILQVEEELHNLRQENQDLSQYFATVKATYERLKFLRPPCKSCYKSHFEPTMVAKFLAGLSPEYATAKDQMLTGSEIPDLSDAYNRLSRLAISLSQPTGVTPASALAVGGGRSHGSTYSARGRGMGRGTGGRGRFQCTYCGKIGHLEDRCWDKHGRSSSLSQGKNMVTKQGKSPAYLSMGSAQTATPTLEESSPSIASETDLSHGRPSDSSRDVSSTEVYSRRRDCTDKVTDGEKSTLNLNPTSSLDDPISTLISLSLATAAAAAASTAAAASA
ncbi:hypothetical protein EJ110_NYTH49167 [Nymphaea thermarum]|nr:hypothetical protein EJ110_NYTH49167 [Nymphaea thermarum]